jgi:hypothetical protein
VLSRLIGCTSPPLAAALSSGGRAESIPASGSITRNSPITNELSWEMQLGNVHSRDNAEWNIRVKSNTAFAGVAFAGAVPLGVSGMVREVTPVGLIVTIRCSERAQAS